MAKHDSQVDCFSDDVTTLLLAGLHLLLPRCCQLCHVCAVLECGEVATPTIAQKCRENCGCDAPQHTMAIAPTSTALWCVALHAPRDCCSIFGEGKNYRHKPGHFPAPRLNHSPPRPQHLLPRPSKCKAAAPPTMLARTLSCVKLRTCSVHWRDQVFSLVVCQSFGAPEICWECWSMVLFFV